MSAPPNYPEKQPYSDSSSTPMLPLSSAPYPPYPAISTDQAKPPHPYEQQGQLPYPPAQSSYAQGQMPMLPPPQEHVPYPVSYSPNMQIESPQQMQFQQPIQQQTMVYNHQQPVYQHSNVVLTEVDNNPSFGYHESQLSCLDKVIICLVRPSYHEREEGFFFTRTRRTYTDPNIPPSGMEKCCGLFCICLIVFVGIPLLIAFLVALIAADDLKKNQNI